jgi:hypothetical protein
MIGISFTLSIILVVLLICLGKINRSLYRIIKLLEKESDQ